MIYFVANAERQAIKIGFSDNPWARFRALKTASPDRLTLLCVIEGDQGAEHRMHRDWADHRLSGEWFRDTPELRSAIERRRKAGAVGPLTLARGMEVRKELEEARIHAAVDANLEDKRARMALKIGDPVIHQQYGIGRVIDIEDDQGVRKAIVAFAVGPERKFRLAAAWSLRAIRPATPHTETFPR